MIVSEIEGDASNRKRISVCMQRLFETLEQDETEVRRRLVDMSRTITVLRVNEKILARKYMISQQAETALRQVMRGNLHRCFVTCAQSNTGVIDMRSLSYRLLQLL